MRNIIQLSPSTSKFRERLPYWIVMAIYNWVQWVHRYYQTQSEKGETSLLQTECVPSPQTHMLKPYCPLCWYLEMGPLESNWHEMKSWWLPLREEIIALTYSFSLPLPWEHSEKVDVCKAGRALSLDPTMLTPWYRTWGFQNHENMNFCCLSPISLWQPEQIKASSKSSHKVRT